MRVGAFPDCKLGISGAALGILQWSGNRGI
jgi:hypothetical protein